MPGFSEAMIGDVLEAVTPEWTTAREVHARLGQWAPTTVKNVLNRLVAERRLDSRIVQIRGNNSVRHYKRSMDSAGESR